MNSIFILFRALFSDKVQLFPPPCWGVSDRFPPPWWGRVRVGGQGVPTPHHSPPPPGGGRKRPAFPHQGGGNGEGQDYGVLKEKKLRTWCSALGTDFQAEGRL